MKGEGHRDVYTKRAMETANWARLNEIYSKQCQFKCLQYQFSFVYQDPSRLIRRFAAFRILGVQTLRLLYVQRERRARVMRKSRCLIEFWHSAVENFIEYTAELFGRSLHIFLVANSNIGYCDTGAQGDFNRTTRNSGTERCEKRAEPEASMRDRTERRRVRTLRARRRALPP